MLACEQWLRARVDYILYVRRVNIIVGKFAIVPTLIRAQLHWAPQHRARIHSISRWFNMNVSNIRYVENWAV